MLVAPKVSVVVPVFNCASYVGEAIRSALRQEGVILEVILVDDGSTDDTPCVLASFGDRIEVLRQQNSGPGAARNAGIRVARGDYIAFLDADDVWLPGKLAVQVAHLESVASAGAAYSQWHVWQPDADGRYRRPAWADTPVDPSIPVSSENSGSLYNSLLLDCHILTSTVVVRRTLLQSVGWFDEGLRCGEDYDFWLRMSRHTRIDCMAMVGTLYRVTPGSATRVPQPVNAEREVLLRALSLWGSRGLDGNEAESEQIARRLEMLSAQFAHAHLWHGDPRLALDWLGSRISADPVRPKLWGLAAVAGFRWLVRLGRRPVH